MNITTTTGHFRDIVLNKIKLDICAKCTVSGSYELVQKRLAENVCFYLSLKLQQ